MIEKYFIEHNYNKIDKSLKKSPFIYNFDDYDKLYKYKYTIKDIKDIAKRLKLIKCNKTKKSDLLYYYTNILYLSLYVKKIQECWRKYFIYLFNKTLGPSYRKFNLSNNMDDFLTTENIKDIDYYYYFSFKDNDNFVYTFNIISIVSLLNKNIKQNPYNRNDFNIELIDKIKKRVKYNKILNKLGDFKLYEPKELTLKEKIFNLFHKMDQLGNYTSVNWFLDLNERQIFKFLFELYEIWNFRAQLNSQMKRNICPPHGNPFINCSKRFLTNVINQTQLHNYNMITLRTIAYKVMYILIYTSPNDTNKNMGVLYILSSLTLVSENARNSLPWLYTSVYYN